jgi:hypothetical protein
MQNYVTVLTHLLKKDIILTGKLHHSSLRQFLMEKDRAAINTVQFAVSRGPHILAFKNRASYI